MITVSNFSLIQYPFASPLVPVEPNPIGTLTISDSLIISEAYSKISLRNFSLFDILMISESFSAPSLLDISFTTIGNTLTLPYPEEITIFPYNFIPPVSWAKTDYALMVSDQFNYNVNCLFRVKISLSFTERRNLQSYFSYWRTNPFQIQIEGEFWQGYLTPNNQSLLQSQFPPTDSQIIIEFEAMRVK